MDFNQILLISTGLLAVLKLFLEIKTHKNQLPHKRGKEVLKNEIVFLEERLAKGKMSTELRKELEQKYQEKIFFFLHGVRTSYKKIFILQKLREKSLVYGIDPFELKRLVNFISMDEDKMEIKVNARGFYIFIMLSIAVSVALSYLVVVQLFLTGHNLFERGIINATYIMHLLVLYVLLIAIFIALIKKEVLKNVAAYYLMLKVKRIVEGEEELEVEVEDKHAHVPVLASSVFFN